MQQKSNKLNLRFTIIHIHIRLRQGKETGTPYSQICGSSH